MTQRILSISGLRGVIGDGLDPAYVVEFAAAVGRIFNPSASPVGRIANRSEKTLSERRADGLKIRPTEEEDGLAIRPTVVVSRDGRSTGMMVRHAVLAGLTATGCRVVDAGIAATPTVGVLVDHLRAAGGLQITASHNPVEWNGLKPFTPDGSVFDEEWGRRLLDSLHGRSFDWAAWDGLGTVETLDDPAAPHLQRVLGLIDVEAIRRRKLKVVLDCNHGSGGGLGPRLLEELGCDVQVLGGQADGRFEHPPEPLKENLTGLCDAVLASGADIGFAQDPDADRLAVVDGQGRYLGEELTLALCADYLLTQRPGPFVVNGSTSRVTADIAARHGCPFHRSFVGEAHVVAKMKETGAVLGGEGNGGVIEPRVGFVRDSFVGMACVLAGLAESGRPVGRWADSLPQYTIVKDKLTCPRERVADACRVLKTAYSDAEATAGDGLRLDWPDRWVQVRASNTEPILRVIAEAPDASAATRLCTEAVALVRQAVTPPI